MGAIEKSANNMHFAVNALVFIEVIPNNGLLYGVQNE